LFAEYNKKTNIDMNTIIATLDNHQWNKEFDGYFNSIKSLCNHIYISDFNWLKRFSTLKKFRYIDNRIFKDDLKFGSIVLQEIPEYIAKRKELDEIIIQFIDEIADSDLDQYLSYSDSHGALQKRLFGGSVLHMFNHQTHHRGMISLYLEHIKINNDYSNLIDMV
jgi:uncharacterized damage-inducible protein DinB